MKILIYEDSGYKKLYPLNMLRATCQIRIGANSLLQRIENIINNKFEITLHCRNFLSEYLKEIQNNKVNIVTKDDYLLLNGRVIFTLETIDYLLSKKNKNCSFRFNNEIVAAYISSGHVQVLKEKVQDNNNLFDDDFFTGNEFDDVSIKSSFKIRSVKYAWDIIDHMTHGELENDFIYYSKKKNKISVIKNDKNYLNHKKIFCSKRVNIMQEVVLDANEGDIIIEEDVTIEPFVFIKGPVYIGKKSLIKSGARIYGPCIIGEYSKVAGEIAESILHSYVNKQHDGFLGHSYVCPFVNLGADTVTSDLKNNYSSIKAKIDNEEVDTGIIFLGSIMGDHTKTSINTMLNTGSNIGIFANIFGSGFPDKTIQSFSWNETGKPSLKYNVDKAISTAKIVMERRGLKMSEEYEKLLRYYSSEVNK